MLTITSPAATTDLTTLAAVKAELGITTTTDDAYIATLIAAASAAAVAWCRRTFAHTGYSETFRPSSLTGGYSGSPASSRLRLGAWPVASVVSVAEGTAPLAPTDYELDAEAGILWRLDAAGNRIAWPNSKITVAFSAGWLLPNEVGRTLPVDIERAAILLTKTSYMARARDPLVKAESVAGVLDTQFWVGAVGASSLLPEAENLLAPYRLPPI